MYSFVRLLVLERGRRLNSQYGWAGYACAGLMLTAIGIAGAASAAGLAPLAGADQLARSLVLLWAGWVIFAVISGKDLSWQIRLDHLLIFPSPGFHQLYAMAFLLGFLSLPLVVGLMLALYGAYMTAGLHLAPGAATLIGYLLFVASVRFSASLGRAAVYRWGFLGWPRRAVAILALIFPLGIAVALISGAEIEALHPGVQLGLAIFRESHIYALSCLASLVTGLAAADYYVQRELTYSGERGRSIAGSRIMPGLLLVGPTRPSPYFRIGLLGWLRSRNAFLMFVFGGVYSFCWTHFSRPSGTSYYLLFVLMNLAFHAYLRGNLLGIDRGGIWIYYSFPGGIDRVLTAKSLSLTLLQGCMLAALIVPGFFQGGVAINLIGWGRILSYAFSSLLFGEVWGLFFSARYPEPVDRNSPNDGGTAVGALAGGAVQVIFMAVFILASRYASRILSPTIYWMLLIALPASLSILRFALLPGWVRETMLEDRETIFRRLAVYRP